MTTCTTQSDLLLCEQHINHILRIYKDFRSLPSLSPSAGVNACFTELVNLAIAETSAVIAARVRISKVADEAMTLTFITRSYMMLGSVPSCLRSTRYAVEESAYSRLIGRRASSTLARLVGKDVSIGGCHDPAMLGTICRVFHTTTITSC